ncbi:YbaK/EbsC family protein [Pseudomaricurvus alkylphenolicus]|jgi:Ala-tRNA(Pro) deacylase|uniref:aminoacyl-tRNA deacylase n=1 Tax=Pseudomaricurvus alkylphenolicus TaxID=1306991 RepID=UPI00141EB15D|nr:YbaK/EbsC family protein [Pseudomaricurvus alkylphenolicus]NIB40093.1 YbaK/EbsC family protein [Pseudomaricurvus alkylphenolicus]
MGVAITLENYLNTKAVDYDILEHKYSEGSYNTALCARVPAERLVKGVVFRDEDLHYTMAVLPASHRVLRHTLNQIMDRRLELADEEELEDIFFDCERGAIPCLGQAYGINVIWDDGLAQGNEVWLEAGDHEHLIHFRGSDFKRLMQDFMHERISCDRNTAAR